MGQPTPDRVCTIMVEGICQVVMHLLVLSPETARRARDNSLTFTRRISDNAGAAF